MDVSNELLENFRVSEQEASVEVLVKLSEYPDYFEEYKPIVPYQKLLEGYELYIEDETKDKNGFVSTDPIFLEDNIERSIRRTKKQITDYIICDEFDLFCTFTFKDDRYDLPKCKKRMSVWLTNQKKQYGHFNYILVPELHKDGAIHFHALFGGYMGKLNVARNPHTQKPLKTKKGTQLYNLGGYKLGLSSAEFISSKKKAGAYLRKYITKEMILFHGKKRYWASRGLKLPEITYNPIDQSYRDYKIVDVWWNKLGSKVRYEKPKNG